MGGNHKRLFGLFLIIFGLFYYVKSFRVFSEFEFFAWPFVLLILSAGFHISFFIGDRKKEKAGLLVPGGILFVLGLMFVFETAAGLNYAGSIWPVYFLSAAFGLFELWLFGGRERGLLLPIFVLSAVAVFYIAEQFLPIRGSFWPFAAIVIGVYYVLRKNHPEKTEE